MGKKVRVWCGTGGKEFSRWKIESSGNYGTCITDTGR